MKNKNHRFESLGDFDKAIRHIATVPKEVVDERVADEKARRKAERKKQGK